MQDRLRNTHPFPVPKLVVVAALALPFAAACSDDDDDGGDKTAPTVAANPTTSAFAGPDITVMLTAMDAKDSDPDIYYTTDLSTPTAASTAYTGPITISATTVLKFIAVDAKGNESDVALEGYTLAANPIAMELAASGHGNITGEPFRHWDEDGEVQASCAKCHAGGGFVDFALDGSVDAPAALPFGLECSACHDGVPFTLYDDLVTYTALEPLEFPSGVEASLFNHDNMCMTCHQGRESGLSVDEDIADDPDGPYTFINIHYYSAAATYMGGETNGGYQYDGLSYAGRQVFPSHEATERTCVGCHMQGAEKDHTFEPDLATCQTCHSGASFETLGGSPATNFDAITVTHDELLDEIKDYALNVIGEAIAYGDHHPYFFFDLNGNGMVDPDEGSSSNRYDLFDAPLLKAAYNYQAAAKDPAGYIHNGTYLRQIIQDSVEDLGGAVSVPAPGRAGFDHDAANKSEQWHLSGHSDSTGEAFRHWDVDGEVPESCATCHSSPGFADYIADGTVDAPAPLGSLVECTACHNDTNLYVDASTKYDDLLANPALDPVDFPSGDTQTLGDASNMCMTCHQGRESGVSVTAPTPNSVVQTPVDYDSFDFINRHYYAAAAIFFGTDVNAAFEYAGASYEGQNPFTGHAGGLGNCLECHAGTGADHSFEVELEACDLCHESIADFEELGLPFGATNVDYDGDSIGESFQDEIDGMASNLLAGIYAYSDTGLPQSTPIVYGPGSYPYWFHDLDADGVLDLNEPNFGNRYQDFDLNLLRAAYNFHSGQDPCSDMHNYKYVLQSLYDSADFLDDGVLNLSAVGTRP
jgi:hypothetical protein